MILLHGDLNWNVNSVVKQFTKAHEYYSGF